MIRSNVPMPLLFRLRMRASLVARRAQTGLLSRRQRGGVEDERAIWTKSAGRHADACSPETWSDFIEHYERFTGALADPVASEAGDRRKQRQLHLAHCSRRVDFHVAEQDSPTLPAGVIFIDF